MQFPDQGNGEKVIGRLQALDLNCELDFNEEFEDWTCTCSKEMFLIYEDIVEMQKELNKPGESLVDIQMVGVHLCNIEFIYRDKIN